VTTEAGFRLSPQQKRLWRLQGQDPWRACCLARIDGELAPGELEAALQEVVRRNEVLRTAFRTYSGASLPLQVILEGAPVAYEEHDLGSRTAVDRAAWAEEAYAGIRGRRLDLAAAPVLHAAVARMGASSHALLLALPALDGDAASLPHLAKRVLSACRARRRGEKLPEEPVQYADLAEWAIEQAESEEARREADRWREHDLAGAVGQRLPFAAVGEPYLSRTEALELDLPRGFWAELRRTGRSPESFLLAGWQALIRRITGAAEVAVGVSGHERDVDGLESALGLFERVVPLVQRPEGDEGLGRLSERGEEGLRSLRERQHLFSWDAFWRDGTGAPPPFLPFAFSWREEEPALREDGLSSGIDRCDARVDRFAVQAAFHANGERTKAELRYDAGVCAPGEIERLAGSFAALLADALERPEAPLDDLSLLGEGELRRVIVDFNPPGPGFPEERQVEHSIEDWVVRTPDAPAVACGGEAISYRELNARAGALARRLRAQGVGPDVLVLLFVERSIEMIVGILGVLEAGGAYVPLDPASPMDRLAFILEDSKAPVVLTQERLTARLPAHQGQNVLLDEASAPTPAAPSTVGEAGPEHLAYVIYTSGSTGRPKGVLVTRRNLMHSTHARLLYYRDPVKKFLLLSSFAFDSSVAGIFWALASGGTLVLPEEGAEKELRRVVGLIREHGISHLLCLGSLHDVLLSEADPRDLASLEVAIVAGEACTGDLVDRHRRRLPSTRLFNEYGPTEATVWSSVYDCTEHRGDRPVPIGRPIPNSRIYVLDPSRRPAPVGVPGELYVGGPGVARGYLNRPELTAERFVPDPFGPPDGRLYRTGDSVRFMPDGNLEFLGRLDHQVKLRGFRIELGEIEQVLAGHPAVKAAAVLVRAQAGGPGQLAAFLAFKPGPEPTVTELRSFVRQRLPEYMVPSAFEILDALPLNANGKIDRTTLAQAGAARQEDVAPRTPMETLVAETWAEALGTPQVGVRATFLDLGGHSLLAMRVIARLEDRLGVRIHPRELLFGTLEQFAASLERHRQEPPVRPDSRWRRVGRWLGLVANRASSRTVLALALDQLELGGSILG